MNKDNAKEFLPLIQALADGKTIQIKPLDCEWEDTYRIDVCYPAIYYRIKPEPRRWAMVRCLNNGFIYEDTGTDGFDSKVWERITVQEVLK